MMTQAEIVNDGLGKRAAPWPAVRLAAAVAAVGFGQSALIAVVPVVSARAGIAADAIGLAAFAGALAFVAAAPLWGHHGAGWPLRRLLAGLAVLMLAGQALLALPLVAATGGAAATVLIVVSRIVYGVGAAGVMPHAQAALVRATPPAGRPAALARLSAGLGVGRVLGSLAPGLGAAGALVALAASPLFLLAAPSLPMREDGPSGEPAGRGVPDRGSLRLFAAAFALTFGLGQVQIVLGLFLARRLGLDAPAAAFQAGLAFAAVALTMILVQVALVPRLGGRLAGSLRVGAAAFAAGCIVVAAAPVLAIVIAGMVLAGAGLAAATPAYTAALANRTVPARQAQMAGWLSSVHVVGQGAGALVGGLAFAASPLLPFAAAAALGLAVAALAGRPGHPRA